MNLALRELCDADSASGEGPIEVMTRYRDFNVVTVQNPQGQPMQAPADSLIAFTAQRFRELGDKSGVWEFRVEAPTKPGAPTAMARLYLCGEDILTVRALSKVMT
jgi:hypothetical protein